MLSFMSHFLLGCLFACFCVCMHAQMLSVYPQSIYGGRKIFLSEASLLLLPVCEFQEWNLVL